jgi:transposase InsO family protein
MSWKESKVAEKRLEFVKLLQDGRYTMTELCDRFGIARSNGYKWVDRYLEAGLDGLKDRRRGPRDSPLKTPQELEALILAERDQHPTWGPRKLLAVLARDMPDVEAWPAASTVYDILKRNGRIQSIRRRRKHEHPGKPFVEADLPNSVWAADYKGQFRLGNGRLCYPLTVTDGFSRYLFAAHALPSTDLKGARNVFLRLFKTYGLPEAILTDNGTPFCSTGLAGLTQLSVWWLRLGIRRIRTQPGHPQQNGRHERMHRTLKAEATQPPQQTMRAQQLTLESFRHEFNDVRPHEALDNATPASLYESSPRPYPTRLPTVEYPSNFITRLVSSSGSIRLNSAQIHVTSALAGQHVGLEECGDGLWGVYFATEHVGKLDVRTANVK